MFSLMLNISCYVFFDSHFLSNVLSVVDLSSTNGHFILILDFFFLCLVVVYVHISCVELLVIVIKYLLFLFLFFYNNPLSRNVLDFLV